MFDSTMLAALGTVPTIEAIIEYLKTLGLPGKLSPIFAVLLGIGLNVIIGVILGWPVRADFALGIIAGFGAAGWHETLKSTNSNTPQQ